MPKEPVEKISDETPATDQEILETSIVLNNEITRFHEEYPQLTMLIMGAIHSIQVNEDAIELLEDHTNIPKKNRKPPKYTH